MTSSSDKSTYTRKFSGSGQKAPLHISDTSLQLPRTATGSKCHADIWLTNTSKHRGMYTFDTPDGFSSVSSLRILPSFGYLEASEKRRVHIEFRPKATAPAPVVPTPAADEETLEKDEDAEQQSSQPQDTAPSKDQMLQEYVSNGLLEIQPQTPYFSVDWTSSASPSLECAMRWTNRSVAHHVFNVPIRWTRDGATKDDEFHVRIETQETQPILFADSEDAKCVNNVIDFGDTAVDTTATLRIPIRSSEEVELLKSWETHALDSGFTVIGFSGHASVEQPGHVVVEFQPTHARAYSDRLTIRCPGHELILTMRGSGVVPSPEPEVPTESDDNVVDEVASS